MFGAGDSGLGFGVAYTLYDEFTGPARRIQSRFNDLEGTTQNATEKINRSMSRLSSGAGALVGAGAMLAPFFLAFQEANRVEDALADVTKTTGIAGEELQALRRHIESIDTRSSVMDLIGIAKAAGSMGIAQQDVASFTESVDKLNVALGDQFESAEVMARELTQMRNVLQDMKTDDPAADLMNIGNVLNFMGANAATTEASIADVASRLAGIGGTLGMSSAQIFGVSTALTEMGVSSEVAGTNFPLALQRMSNDVESFARVAGMNTAEFSKLVNTNIVEAFMRVASGARAVAPTATEMTALLDELGLNGARVGQVFLAAGNNTDLLRQRIEQAGNALGNTDSIMGEFFAKNMTRQALMEKFYKRVGILVAQIGDALAPVFAVAATVLTAILEAVSGFVNTNTGKILIGVAAAATLVVAGLSAIGAVTTMIIPALYSMASAALAAMAPLWPIILIGIAVAGVFYAIYKAVQIFKESLASGQVYDGFLGFLQKIGGVIMGVIEIWRTWNGETFSLSEEMVSHLDNMGILDFVVSIGTWVVRVKEFLGALADGFMEVFSPFLDLVGKLWNQFTEVLSTLFDVDMAIGRNTSSLEGWQQAGRVVGQIFGYLVDFALIPLVMLLTQLGIAIVTVIATLRSIWEVVTDWEGATQAIGAVWETFTTYITNKFGEVITWFKGLPEQMQTLGSQIVQSIKTGLMNAWSGLTDWLGEAWSGLTENIPGLQMVLEGEGAAANVAPAMQSGAIRGAMAQQTARNITAGQNTETTNNNNTVERVRDVQVNFNLDGKQFTEVVRLQDLFDDYLD